MNEEKNLMAKIRKSLQLFPDDMPPLTRPEERTNPKSGKIGMTKPKFDSRLEKQKPKGKSDARDWMVQTGKGGAFVLKHRESGDFYADYVTTPITSWGCKRFVTKDEAYKYLNDSKNFNQPKRKA